jgi:hypothetical protein
MPGHHRGCKTVGLNPMLNKSQPDSIQASAVDILQGIEQRIQQQRQALNYDRIFSPYDDIVFPGNTKTVSYEDPRPNLQQAQARYNQFDREILLTASKLDQVPVIGRFWRTVRHQLHSIALFYVNRALAHEAAVNYHLIQVLTYCLDVTQQQQRAIFKMQAEINAGRAQARE